MKETILRTKSLTKQYGEVKAVDAVNMTIRKGDIYGFIGENGAGKTTLIRMITSLISPTSGEVELFSKSDSYGLSIGRKKIGCIVESPAFYPGMTAYENLEYYRIQRGIPDREAIMNSLKKVDLVGTGKKRYQEFSLGMKQRLGLALAIMGHPDLLILDEPINGLDPKGIIEFRAIINDLQHNHGMTVLISSHILSELSQVANTFGIIHEGCLIKEFSHEQLEAETKRCIAVKVDDSAKAVTILQENLHTTEFEVMPNNEIHIYSYLDNPSEITFQLSTQGVRVLSANELGVSLEEYFFDTIGNSIGRMN